MTSYRNFIAARAKAERRQFLREQKQRIVEFPQSSHWNDEVCQHSFNFQTVLEDLSDDEHTQRENVTFVTNFGKTTFIPIGKTQRSLDEPTTSSESSSMLGGGGDLESSEHDEDEHEEEEEGEGEGEGDEGEGEDEEMIMLGGDLDDAIEDLDVSGATDQSLVSENRMVSGEEYEEDEEGD